ncbi:MAG: uncharacterized protein K0R34_1423 [Herbinix sp.]|nr:uncharacterized protein [Herbinix sp.]
MALVFLPWIRLGLGALNTTHTKQEIREDGSINVLQTARRNIEINTKVKDKSGGLLGEVSKSFTLKGPGEVLGFSDQAVSLIEPLNNETSFAPNQIPYVDFKDADFPWRYSLEEPDAENRLKPWLILIVLKRGEYSELPPGRSCRMISVSNSLLPDLNDSWAYAHAQVSATTALNNVNIKEYIIHYPNYAHSRIICTRKLQPSQNYTAFLVPVYKMGVQAAMELTIGDTQELAWIAGNDRVSTLPYYFRWEFSTSTIGDFEDLARRIEVYDNKEAIIGSNKVSDIRSVEMEFDGMVLPYNKQPSDKTYNISFSNNAITQFNKMYASQRQVVTAQSGEPELFIPLYGQNHSDSSNLTMPNANGTWANSPGSYNPSYDPSKAIDLWFSEVNLDRNYRYAAALGASVVRYNQDELISQCFAMVGDIKEVNQLEKRYKTLKGIRKNIISRHLNTLDNIRFMHVTKNLQMYYMGNAIKKSTSKDGNNGLEGFPVVANTTVHSVDGMELQSVLQSSRSTYSNLSMNLLKNMNICNSLGDMNNEKLMNFQNEEEKNSFMIDAGTFKNMLLNTDTQKEVLNRIVSTPDGTEVGDAEIYLEPKIEEGVFKYIPIHIMKNLIPGLAELPNNKSMLLKVNRKFLEAFMLGANHEMVRELIWREYPIDRRATVFNSFWGAADANREDIVDIKNWSKSLGDNVGSGKADKENIIVAIKSDLFRRYPKTMLYAVEYDPLLCNATKGWDNVINAVKQGVSSTGAKLHNPLFVVDVMENLKFVYYDLTKQYMDSAANGTNPGGVRKFCFVILENMTVPKFGLDESKISDKKSFDDLSWCDFDVNKESGYLNISTIDSKIKAMTFSNTGVNKEFKDAAKMAVLTINKPSGVIMDFSSIY